VCKKYVCTSCEASFHLFPKVKENAPDEIEFQLNESEDKDNIIYEEEEGKEKYRLAVVPDDSLPDRNFGFGVDGYSYAYWIPERFYNKIKGATQYSILLSFIKDFRRKYFNYQGLDPDNFDAMMGEAVEDLTLQYISRKTTEKVFRDLLDKGLLWSK